jgi:hypothetical protein
VPSRFKTDELNVGAGVQFRGYQVKQGVPEFWYDVDGIEIHETIAPTPEGKALVRRFRLSTGEKDVVYRIPDGARVMIEAGGARIFMGGVHLPANTSVTFSLTSALP